MYFGLFEGYVFMEIDLETKKEVIFRLGGRLGLLTMFGKWSWNKEGFKLGNCLNFNMTSQCILVNLKQNGVPVLPLISVIDLFLTNMFEHKGSLK